MIVPRMMSALVMAAVISAWAASVPAQSFPVRPITIIVPFPPGGVTDPVARAVAAKIQESTGQPVVVDNRPGAGGVVAAEIAKRAPADGYTVFFSNFATHAVNVTLYNKLPYDPVRDFQPLTKIIATQSMLVVPVDSPAKTPADLVAMAKSKPNGLTFASQGIGAGGHLQGEMFKKMTGAPLTHVPYKGSGPALQDMLAGRVDLFFDAFIPAGPHTRDGKLRALAVTSKTRSKLYPDLPTMEELGFKGMELDAWFGMFVPAGTSQPVVRKLHEEFVKAIRSPDLTKRFTDLGLDIVTNTPEEFAAQIVSDITRLGQVVRDAGAKVD
jgi:tripartite-type tricarboxylate transporter receptor subunit TctC